ncbi:MAG: hydantoinase/oxoprolinase family protein [Gammaproteobacteria bacterium]|nr:hydantoinase/oxoprolinase family protein [Gammaproteobacteria bacterium]
MTNRLAIDIGGTFTDVVLECGEEQFTRKVLTSHDQPADAVLRGIRELFSETEVSSDSISLVLHGTTLATNAIIERRGARTALLTTEGHRDVLAMAFENRFEQYDVNIERPEPLIPRYLRIPVYERMGPEGVPLRALDRVSVDDAIETLNRENVESVAVGFLHSYTNSAHEDAVAEQLAKALPDVALSLSSQVCPEIREYERFSTTCANAYVLPLMATYLHDLSERMQAIGIHCPFLVMTSNGGLTTLANAVKFPIRLVESGPAGGAVLAAWKARQLGVSKALSFDMGGTTAKICMIDEGAPLRSRSFEVDRRYRFKKGSGLPVRIPVIEMVEIGAGGGSIAHVDQLKRVRVGPESAGSEPGPACYGIGGDSPTVTDADAVMGRLEAGRFAGGQMTLDLDAGKHAIVSHILRDSREKPHDAARAIAEVVDENMASAARGHASEWGKTVAERVLIAYGGAAPLHATRLISKLNCDYALIPVGAGVGSALGFLRSPIAYEVVHSKYMRLSTYDRETVARIIDRMHAEAKSVVSQAVNELEVHVSATAYMRYVGQGYEISVPLDLENLSLDQIRSAFEVSYETLYGRLLPKSDIEVMSWTLTLATVAEEPTRLNSAIELERFNDACREQALTELDMESVARCIDRENLKPGHHVLGPALISERHTTTLVPTGFELVVNRAYDLIVRRCVA